VTRFTRNALALLLGVALVVVPALAFAQPNPVKVAAAATVQMYVDDVEMCSAVVVAPGMALTAAHCKMEGSMALERDGKRYPITAWSFPRAGEDVAIITVPGLGCACAPIGGAPLVETEQDVVIIGFPNGNSQAATYGWVVGRGVVHGKKVIILKGASVRGGNSGGGVFVVDGSTAYLVGILVMGDMTDLAMAVEVTR
jgi:V8-like Glu-specific endopeptidase